MNKFYLVLLGFFLSLGNISAEVISHYTCNFDTAFGALNGAREYTDPAAAPDGWAHMPDGKDMNGYGKLTYPTYSFETKTTYDGAGSLYVNAQNRYNRYEDDYVDFYDLLVTPRITGTASLYARLSSASGSVSFYKIKEAGGKLIRGAKILVARSAKRNEWTQLVIPSLNGERIGIRIDQAYIDNFTADQAEITFKPNLIISGRPAMAEYHDVDDNGNYTLAWKVVLKNNGKIKVNGGEYSLKLLAGTDTLASFPIVHDIAVGASSDTILVTRQVNIAQLGTRSTSFSIVETASGSVYKPQPVVLTPARGILEMKDGRYAIENGSWINFGSSASAASFVLTVSNAGGRPLHFTSLALPAGYTASVMPPFTLAAHASTEVTLTRTATPVGPRRGELKLSGDTTFVLNLTGSSFSGDIWTANFEDNRIPSSFIAGGWDTNYYPQYALIVGNKYALKAPDAPSMLVTPKLRAGAGDKLQFSVASASSATGTEFEGNLKVYISANRHKWTLLDTFSATAADETHRLSKARAGRSGAYYQSIPYTVTLPAGRWYVAFEGDHVYLDDIAGLHAEPLGHDLYLSSAVLPAAGAVNSRADYAVSVQNLGVDEAEGSYRAQLFVDGVAVDSAAAVSLPAGGSASFSFHYTPHAAGSYRAYVQLSGAGFTLSTDTVATTVAAETGERVVQIGKPSTSMWSGTTYAPVYGTRALSQTEIALAPEALPFGAGTRIKAVAFQGTVARTAVQKVHAMIGCSTVKKFSFPYAFSDHTGWTTIYNGPYNFEKTTATAEIMKINMASPFVYDGTSLHLFFDNELVGEGAALNFTKEATGQLCSAIMRDKYATGAFTDADKPSSADAPVVYLTIERNPAVLSGVVTSRQTRRALAGIPVKLTCNDVVYTATTGADGRYSLTVYKLDNAYTLSVSAGGYMPFEVENVRLSADSTLNFSLNAARGFYISRCTLPATATVNTPYTATAHVRNVEHSALSASAYTARLYVNGEAVARAESQTVAAGGEADFTFRFTPHAALTAPACIVFNVNDDVVNTSDTVSLAIQPEKARGTWQAGDSLTLSSTGRAPASLLYANSKAVVIYPKNIIGMPAGSDITRLYFKGYTSGSGTDYDARVKVYLQNTDDAPFADNGEYSVSGLKVDSVLHMTKVYDGTLRVVHGKGSASNADVVLDFVLDQKFKYDGRNLRMTVIYSSADGSSSMDVHYVSDSRFDKAVYLTQSDISLEAAKTWYQRTMPVAYFEAERGQKFSGTVTAADGHAVAGAVVTLASDDVMYTGTTGADGHFDITVIQTGRTYTAEISAPGYLTGHSQHAIADAPVTCDVVLAADPATSVRRVDSEAASKSAAVYDFSGRLVGRTAGGRMPSGLAPGIYIVSGRKVIVK